MDQTVAPFHNITLEPVRDRSPAASPTPTAVAVAVAVAVARPNDQRKMPQHDTA